LEKDNFAGKSTITKENARLCTIIVAKMKKILCKVKIDKKSKKQKKLPYIQ
jgi:hypothetical protein